MKSFSPITWVMAAAILLGRPALAGPQSATNTPAIASTADTLPMEQPAAPTDPASIPQVTVPSVKGSSVTGTSVPGMPPSTADAGANANSSKGPIPDAPAGPVPPGALEVTATGTLEWLRDQNAYIARQNAVAKRNDTIVKGDVLVAHYRTPPGKKDGVEITQVTADGNPVELTSPNAVAYGQHGVYDLGKHVMVLTGDSLRLVTTKDVITAKDSLEYFEDLSTGVARGDAVAVQGDNKLSADVIAAKFTKGGAGAAAAGRPAKAVDAKPAGVTPNGKSQSLERLDAKGHVVLVTPTDVVNGDEGVYNPQTDQATVLGNVHVTRGENQLDGARAEIDMKTGISRVFSAPDTRVRGLFVPRKKDEAAGRAGRAEDASFQTAPPDGNTDTAPLASSDAETAAP